MFVLFFFLVQFHMTGDGKSGWLKAFLRAITTFLIIYRDQTILQNK